MDTIAPNDKFCTWLALSVRVALAVGDNVGDKIINVEINLVTLKESAETVILANDESPDDFNDVLKLPSVREVVMTFVKCEYAPWASGTEFLLLFVVKITKSIPNISTNES